MLNFNLFKLDTVFKFGKHRGLTLKEVMKKAPEYIDWCIGTLPGFVITKESLIHLQKLNPCFQLTDKAQYMFETNLKMYEKHLMFQKFVDKKEGEQDLTQEKQNGTPAKIIKKLCSISPLCLEEINYLEKFNHFVLFKRMNQKATNEERDMILDEYNFFIKLFEKVKKNLKSTNRIFDNEKLQELYLDRSEFEKYLEEKNNNLKGNEDDKGTDLPF